MRARAGIWAGACALVVLASRTLAYQLVPRPTLVGLRLEQAVGGPRLVVVTIAAIVGAFAVAAAVVWLAALAVRERHLLVGGPAPAPIRPARVLASAFGLFVASSLVFDALESYLHWRAGLGFHGLHCLIGPEHRDALPLLASTSLVAAAGVAAASHLVRWLRRTLRALVRRPVPFFSPPVLAPARPVLAVARPASERLRTRGPPSVAGTR
jgi:hypothetical protein